jgi:beta-galactosidase
MDQDWLFNCEQIELMLDNKSLGSKSLPADASPRIWKIPFARGGIKAIARNKGNVVATHELRTADKPAKTLLKSDRPNLTADREDLAYVEANIIDRHGVLMPDATNSISFKISGPASIFAVDNGGNLSHEPFHAAVRHACEGRCFAIIKAHSIGTITVDASAQGLPTATTKISVSESRK